MASTGYYAFSDEIGSSKPVDRVSTVQRYKVATAVTVAVCVAGLLVTGSSRSSASVPVSVGLQATSTCPTIEQGIDYLYNDIGSIVGTGAADCCTKCAERSGCVAFTWTNYAGGTCWLKSGKGATIVKAGAVSGLVNKAIVSTPATCPTLQQGVDYIANDIANVPGTGAADCCSKCSQRVGCGAFTWSNYNGGTCWLKSARGATKATAGVVSAVLVRSPTPTPTPTPTTKPPATTKPATTTPATTKPATTTPATTRPATTTPATTRPATTTPATTRPATTTPATTRPATTTPAPTTTAPASSPVCPTFEQGVDYVGNDIQSIAGTSAADCCSKCRQIVGCAAFTWSTGTCWLKSGKGTTATKTGSVSAQLVKTPHAAIYGGVADPNQVQLHNGNPTAYPSNGCTLPNWISKNGKIFATGPNGFEEAISVKGVNWFGMETSATVPLGLWANNETGSTLYSIASFLARNKFNSVRLPICMDSLLRNIVPDRNIVNEAENAAIKLDSYMNLLKSIIKGLGHRGITVMIDIHTLTIEDKGLLWYNDMVPETKFLQGVDMLTSNLCTNEFFNVMGIDVKNEPAEATWGDGSARDFRAAAIRIGNRMLSGCSKWLAFVNGISEFHSFKASTGKTYYFNDWWGGGLARAKQFPVTLSTANKLVYSPHYYPPSVYPVEYYYGDGFSELSDANLKENIKGTFDLQFGYLAQDTTGPALVMGEFGGLYTSDLHPKKTLQRSVDYTIELAMRPGFIGGYIWSLNPESGYDYNPGNTKGFFQEGLLKSSWRAANEPFLKALAAMDKLPDLKPMPCYKW